MAKAKKKTSLVPLVGSILIAQLAGIIGSVFTYPSISSWYVTLNKPIFTPPNSIFGPVWIILYTLMGVAAYLAWTKAKSQKQANYAISWYAIQLALNLMWSIFFFGLHNPALGLLSILTLFVAIFKTTTEFRKINLTAGILMYPYLIWVGFATLLNLAIVFLN